MSRAEFVAELASRPGCIAAADRLGAAFAALDHEADHNPDAAAMLEAADLVLRMPRPFEAKLVALGRLAHLPDGIQVVRIGDLFGTVQ